MSIRRGNIIKYIDWPTILIYLLLVGIGALCLYTATYSPDTGSEFANKGLLSSKLGKQLVWIGISITVAFIIQLFNTQFFTVFSPAIYVSVILLLVGVLILGTEIANSKSWFVIGPISVQPSEFAKFATALAVAKYLSGLNISLTKFRDQVICAAIILLPLILIILQNDAGTAIVFTAFFWVLYRQGLPQAYLLVSVGLLALFLSALLIPILPLTISLISLAIVFALLLDGIDLKKILVLVVAIVIAVVLLFIDQVLITIGVAAILAMAALFFALRMRSYTPTIIALLLGGVMFINLVDYSYHNVIGNRQRVRIDLMLGKIDDPQGIGYNLEQSKIAIGAGGLYGKGYLYGTQTKGKFVPELTTDFIFCTIGEEFGFLGSLGLIGLFFLLFFRIIIIAERQRSRFSRIYGYGVASIIFFHFFVNISMTIGLLPVIGIPLPFISRGGSSLLGFTVLLFILIRLDADRSLILK